MGNLIPEQRADKNGRVVTRHVNGETHNKSRVEAFPNPSIQNSAISITPSMQTRITTRIIKAMELQQFKYLDGGKIIENTLAYLARRSPEDFLALDEEMKYADLWLRRNWAATLDSISFTPPRPLTGQPEQDMLPIFHRTKLIVRLTAKLTEDDGLSPDATALRGAALRGLVSKIAVDDEDTVRAALVATWILPRTANGSYRGAEFLPDNESLMFVKANYEKVMDHRHALRERGSIDPEVMDRIINSGTPSLSSGVL